MNTTTFQNKLNTELCVHSRENNDLLDFGAKLGQLAKLKAQSLQTLESSSGVPLLITVQSNQFPVKFISAPNPQSITITQEDLMVAISGFNLARQVLWKPASPIAKSVDMVLQLATISQQETAFKQIMAQYEKFINCTYQSFLLGKTYFLKHQANHSSILALVKSLGKIWSGPLHDIQLSQTYLSINNNGQDQIWAETTFGALSDIPGIEHVTSMTGQKGAIVFEVQASDSQIAMISWFAKSLTLEIAGKELSLNYPTLRLYATAVWQFFVAELSGLTRISLFDQTFDVSLAMVIDNLQASVTAEISNKNKTLISPGFLQGVHFHNIGVEMGVFFEPPALGLGLSGQFTIGDSASCQVKDDQFATVMNLIDGVPTPVYLSFYLDQISLSELVTCFTNKTSNLELPLCYRDVSVYWSPEPIILPDGTLSVIGVGFRALLDLFGFQLWGTFELNANKLLSGNLSGLSGLAETSKLAIGQILTIAGKGQGISINCDQEGQIIKNNRIYSDSKHKLSVDSKKTLVPPGGPTLKLELSDSPYCQFNMDIQLLGVKTENVSAVVSSEGIVFNLSLGSPLTETVQCSINESQLSADMSCSVDRSIVLPMGLGSLALNTELQVKLKIAWGQWTQCRVSGEFEIEGEVFPIPQFTLSVDTASLGELVGDIVNEIEKHANTLFHDVLTDLNKWVGWVGNNIISGVSSIASILKNVFSASSSEAVAVYKRLGKDVSSVLNDLSPYFNLHSLVDDLKDTYQTGGKEMIKCLKEINESEQEVGTLIYNAFSPNAQDLISWMNEAGFSSGKTKVLEALGYGATQVAQAYRDLYDSSAVDVAQWLADASFALDSVISSLSNVYSQGIDSICHTLQTIGKSPQEIAKGLQDAGYEASQVAKGLKFAFNLGGSGLKEVLKGAGYAKSEVDSALSSVGNTFHKFTHLF